MPWLWNCSQESGWRPAFSRSIFCSPHAFLSWLSIIIAGRHPEFSNVPDASRQTRNVRSSFLIPPNSHIEVNGHRWKCRHPGRSRGRYWNLVCPQASVISGNRLNLIWSPRASGNRFLLHDHVGIRQRDTRRACKCGCKFFGNDPAATRNAPKQSVDSRVCRKDDWLCGRENSLFQGLTGRGARIDSIYLESAPNSFTLERSPACLISTSNSGGCPEDQATTISFATDSGTGKTGESTENARPRRKERRPRRADPKGLAGRREPDRLLSLKTGSPRKRSMTRAGPWSCSAAPRAGWKKNKPRWAKAKPSARCSLSCGMKEPGPPWATRRRLRRSTLDNPPSKRWSIAFGVRTPNSYAKKSPRLSSISTSSTLRCTHFARHWCKPEGGWGRKLPRGKPYLDKNAWILTHSPKPPAALAFGTRKFKTTSSLFWQENHPC